VAGGLLGGLYRDGFGGSLAAAFGQPVVSLAPPLALFVAGTLGAAPSPAGLFVMLAAGLP
jgi:hypothetical protein